MLKRLLPVAALVAPTPVYATSVTVGFWEQSSGAISVTPEITFGEGTNTIAGFYFGNNWGGVLSVVVNTPANTYELAINDVFDTNADTARFYATFSGVTTPFPQLTIPTLFQSSSIQPGVVVVDQVFISPAGCTFCDDYPGLTTGNGLGTDVGEQLWSAATGNMFPTLSGFAPGSPYDITLVIHVASNLSTNPVIGDFMDVANAIVVTPSAMGQPVPGPIVGTGLPAIIATLLGWLGINRKRLLRWWDDRSTWRKRERWHPTCGL